MSQSRAGSLRGLKALVAFLGVLVVLGTAVVVGVVIRRLYAPPSDAANGAAPPLADQLSAAWKPPVTAPMNLPAGSKITAIAATGGLFAISVSTLQGDELWIVDPATGGRYVALTSKP